MERGEAIVRWSPNSDRDEFLSINVGYPAINLYKATCLAIPGQFDYSVVSKHNDYPTVTAYDWSPRFGGLVAVGTKGGDVHLLRVDDGSNDSMVLPLKLQRSCQAVAFNTTGLLAVGLDRVRNDQCLQIWDINQRLSQWDPSKPGWQRYPPLIEPLKLEPSVAVTSARFFEDQPQTLVVGVKNQSMRIHDLRDPQGAVITFQTRCNNNLSINHADPNYFASSALDHPGLVIWDRRAASRQSASASYLEAVDGSDVPWGGVLKISRVIDPTHDAYIRSLRFSRDQRGVLGVLASSGELQVLQLNKEYVEPAPENQVNGSPELLQVRRSYDIKYPYFHDNFPYKTEDRIVSFDWMSTGSDKFQPRLITRSYDQKIAVELLPLRIQHTLFKFLNISSNAGKSDPLALPNFEDPREAISVYGPMASALLGRHLDFSNDSRLNSQDELTQLKSESPNGTADELLSKIADRLYQQLAWMRVKPEQIDQSKSVKDEAQMKLASSNTSSSRPLSSLERHQKAHWAAVEKASRDQLYGVLTSLMNKRIRAKYLFNPIRNQAIVADDPWLQDLWTWVDTAKSAAKDDGMVSGALDLSFMGINTIWNNDLGLEPQNRLIDTAEYPTSTQWIQAIEHLNKRANRLKFIGAKTSRPQYRQLCLSICGCGKTTEELKRELEVAESEGQYTKAAIRALSEKDLNLAVEILRRGGKDLVFVALALSLQTKGIPAFDRSESEDIIQKHPQMATDPYLRAIYTFISTGDWKALADEDSLPLRVRAGIALRNLDDKELTAWLSREEAKAIKTGDIEGIVLTGITEKMVDIFCRYIESFGDYQTAILVMSFANPRYFRDYRVSQWREAYKMHHNEHKLHIPRCHFEVGSTALSRDREGTTAIKPPPRQVTLRCVHCDTASTNDSGNTLSARSTDSASSQQIPGHDADARNPLIASGINAGISCPRCGRHLPRCSICLLTLGMPRIDKQDAGASRDRVLASFISFCMKCDHANHMGCSEKWFAIQNECPVADCRCNCNEDNQRIARENDAAKATWDRLDQAEAKRGARVGSIEDL